MTRKFIYRAIRKPSDLIKLDPKDLEILEMVAEGKSFNWIARHYSMTSKEIMSLILRTSDTLRDLNSMAMEILMNWDKEMIAQFLIGNMSLKQKVELILAIKGSSRRID